VKKLFTVCLVVVSSVTWEGCSSGTVAASSVESEPECKEIRHRYAALTVTHRRLAARGYLVSTRERFVERAQLSEKYPECFQETELGELR